MEESTTQAASDQKQQLRSTWAAGSYADVADRYIAEVGDVLVDRLDVREGETVLDVCTGAGLAAIAAARAGARVTGLDLVPELLTIARERAEATGLAGEWVEADAEALPFPDSSFDVVTSTFGVQFSPNHEASAAEIARVVRPGGTIGLVAWTPASFIGRVFGTLRPYLPPPPPGASPPPLWGSQDHVRALFASFPVELTFHCELAHFRGPTPEEWVEFMADRYGPIRVLRERLPDDSWHALHRDLVGVARSSNAAEDGAFDAPSEYLVVVGRSREQW